MKKLWLIFWAFFTLGGHAFAQIGSNDTDLVYTPVAPCRLFDTRPSQGGTGPIAAAGTKNFTIWGASTYATQGGAASNCGITAGNNTAAVALNVTVVTPAAGGYVTAFPFGVTKPEAATVNFQAGDIARGNFTVAKVSTTTTFDLSIFSSSSVDVVGDVVGYYSKPKQTALLCYTTAVNAVAIAGGQIGSAAAAACATNYSATGIYCDTTNANVAVISNNPTTCFAKNNGSTANNLVVSQRCCSIPGR
jgi:hypothetical protein